MEYYIKSDPDTISGRRLDRYWFIKDGILYFKPSSREKPTKSWRTIRSIKKSYYFKKITAQELALIL